MTFHPHPSGHQRLDPASSHSSQAQFHIWLLSVVWGFFSTSTATQPITSLLLCRAPIAETLKRLLKRICTREHTQGCCMMSTEKEKETVQFMDALLLQVVSCQDILKEKDFLYFFLTVTDVKIQSLPLMSRQATSLLRRGWGES